MARLHKWSDFYTLSFLFPSASFWSFTFISVSFSVNVCNKELFIFVEMTQSALQSLSITGHFTVTTSCSHSFNVSGQPAFSLSSNKNPGSGSACRKQFLKQPRGRHMSDQRCSPTSAVIIKRRGFVYTAAVEYWEWEGHLKPSDPDVHREQPVSRH